MPPLSAENQILYNAISDLSSRVKSIEEIVCQSTLSSGSLLDEARKHTSQIADLKQTVEANDRRAESRIEEHEKVHHEKKPKPSALNELAFHGAKAVVSWISLGLIAALMLGLLAMARPHIIQGVAP